ncbi:MAG TPA: methionine ABC transporter permease [Gammaproteobacteria bacterium]|nr:methionine ABC transporter permease [Gammaproteobacteria bacterium]
MLTQFINATLETLYMVFASGLIGLLLGLPCAVLLYMTARGHFAQQSVFNHAFGLFINAVRSVPFIIFMIALIPLTRLIVGTPIGTTATIVPLGLAAAAFLARVHESALNEVPRGLMEAALSMGATKWQIIFRVLLPEAMPGLIRGMTITLIVLVGYSAMAGVIGGGGLGSLAYQFGYQRFDTQVMIMTVVELIVLVQIIQWLGDFLAVKVWGHK